MADEQKKNIFSSAVDALTTRDEKAAAEAAKVEAEKAKAQAQAAEAELAKVQAEAKAAQQNAAGLQAQIDMIKKQAQAEKDYHAQVLAQTQKMAETDKAAAAAKIAEMEAERAAAKQAADQAALQTAAQAAAKAMEQAATIKHVWTKEDTYASLAQKYYGSFKEPYWRLIYDLNKAIIGDHPNAIRVGLEIEIPSLPEELKKK